MSRNQLQPVNGNNHQLAQRIRPRSLWGQFWAVVLQPGGFFRTLPPLADTRQWLWIGLLILAAIGLSAVQQDAQPATANGNVSPLFDNSSFPGADPGFGDGSSGFDFPIPNGSGTPVVSGESSDINATWTTALIAASEVILGWLILSVLLCEVSLFNGKAPAFGANFQIAVWASVPIGLMAALQLIYASVGGSMGQAGLSGLLAEWTPYAELPVFVKSLALSLASRLTLFWLWSLVLIYFGARGVLGGKWWASILVVLAWAVLLVVLPVVTGNIQSAESATTLPDLLSPFNDQTTGENGAFPFDLDQNFPLFTDAAEATEEVPFIDGNSGFILPDVTPEATVETD